jgi:hypothetical protein
MITALPMDLDPGRVAAARLLEDALLPPLWRLLSGGEARATDQPGLLAGLLRALREEEGFGALGEALLEDATGARAAALWSGLERRLGPSAQHHLALLHTRLGWRALEQGDAREAERRWDRAMWAFGRAFSDAGFLPTLAREVGAAERAGALPGLVVEWLLGPHAAALEGAIAALRRAEVGSLRPHWAVLGRAGAALREGGAPEAIWRGCEAHGERLRARALELAAEGAAALALDLEPTSAATEALVAPFHYLQAVMELAGPQEELSIWAVERAVALCWPPYKTGQVEPLKAILLASAPFAQHVERLLLEGRGAFGRQSVCADHLLFQADHVGREEEEAVLLRALAICPSHKNTHLMLSYVSLRRANAELARCEAAAPLLAISDSPQREAWARARAQVEEAAARFPENPRLGDYRQRLEVARVKLQISPENL